MVNGKIRFGKQSGGELAFVIPDGVTNTEVIFPESGDLVNKDYVDSTTVNLTENQTIGGVKTFSSSPIVPTPTTDFQAVTKKYVDNTAYSVELIEDLITVSSGFNTVIVKDINRGGIFVSKTGEYTVNDGTVFAKLDGGFWVRQYSGAVNVKWFGAKGDCIADDTDAFINSIIYCKSIKHKLDISECKLYLQTLSSPIDITGLEIIGNGVMPNDYEDWPYMSGADNFNAHLAYYKNSIGSSCIVSNYNGAVFTGKTFYVRGVGIYCNPNNSNSAGFIQTVKPVGEYPGWSQALEGDYNNTTIRFTGSYGIYLYGGLEVTKISRLNTSNTKKQGLYIDFTDVETSCPIEYVEFYKCNFMYSNEDNVYLAHAAKQIKFDNCCFNGSGRHFTGTGKTAIESATIFSQIKYGVRIKPKIGFHTLIIDNCYAEESQGMVYVEGGYVYNIQFTNNILYFINSSYIRFALAITSQSILGMEIDGNYYQAADIRVYIHTLSTESRDIYIGNSIDINNSVGIKTNPKTVFTPSIATRYLELSGTLSDGTENTATYTISKTIGSSGSSIAAYSQVYLITASWQAPNSNSGGAYLFIATMMPSGVYMGYTIATSSISGFTAAPTISTDGIISIPLAQYYIGRVTRIDANQTQNMFL